MGQNQQFKFAALTNYASRNIIMQVIQKWKDLHKPIKLKRQPLWVGWFFKKNKKCPIHAWEKGDT